MATTPAKKTPAAAKAATKTASKTTLKAAPKAAKPAPKAEGKAKLALVPAADASAVPEKAVGELKLKDLIDRIVTATGGKKPQVKPLVEAVLREMGDALSAGQGLNLPGFGKARVARTSETTAGTMTIKLRRGPATGKDADKADAAEAMAENSAPEPLAEAAEQD